MTTELREAIDRLRVASSRQRLIGNVDAKDLVLVCDALDASIERLVISTSVENAVNQRFDQLHAEILDRGARIAELEEKLRRLEAHLKPATEEALEADGEKLRQLTGEDHGPFR
jgi:uncharacterized coiled-coil DUF342 family protein